MAEYTKEEPTKEQIGKACKMCAKHNHGGCTQQDFPDPNHWICKAWLAKAEGKQ